MEQTKGLSQAMLKILELPQTSFVSESEETVDKEMDPYQKNLKFLQTHGVFTTNPIKPTNQIISQGKMMKSPNQRKSKVAQKQIVDSEEFTLLYDIEMNKRNVAVLREKTSPNDLKMQKFINELEVQILLKEKIIEKNRKFNQRFQSIQSDRENKLRFQASIRENRKQQAQLDRIQHQNQKQEKLKKAMEHIEECIQRSTQKKQQMEIKHKMRIKEENTKRQEDLIINRYQIDTQQIQRRQQIKQDIQRILKRQNKQNKITQKKAEEMNIHIAKRTEEIKQKLREDQIEQRKKKIQTSQLRENRRIQRLERSLTLNPSMLKWTLGNTASGARLRQTHQDLINNVVQKCERKKKIELELKSKRRQSSSLLRFDKLYENIRVTESSEQSQDDTNFKRFSSARQINKNKLLDKRCKSFQKSKKPDDSPRLNLVSLPHLRPEMNRAMTIRQEDQMKTFSEFVQLNQVEKLLTDINFKTGDEITFDSNDYAPQVKLFNRTIDSNSPLKGGGTLSPIMSINRQIIQEESSRINDKSSQSSLNERASNISFEKTSSLGKKIFVSPCKILTTRKTNKDIKWSSDQNLQHLSKSTSSPPFTLPFQTNGTTVTLRPYQPQPKVKKSKTQIKSSWNFIHGYLGLMTQQSRRAFIKKLTLLQGTVRKLPFEREQEDYATFTDACLKSQRNQTKQRLSVEYARKFLFEKSKGCNNQRALAKAYKTSCSDYLSKVKNMSIKNIGGGMNSISFPKINKSASVNNLSTKLTQQIDFVCNQMKSNLAQNYFAKLGEKKNDSVKQTKNEEEFDRKILQLVGATHCQTEELSVNSRTHALKSKLKCFKQTQQKIKQQLKIRRQLAQIKRRQHLRRLQIQRVQEERKSKSFRGSRRLSSRPQIRQISQVSLLAVQQKKRQIRKARNTIMVIQHPRFQIQEEKQGDVDGNE